MIERDIQHIIPELTATYPVITITGPRQAGKTTLSKMVFPGYKYCNLEDPDIRLLHSSNYESRITKFCILIS